MGDTWHLDELFVNIQGRQQYFWRAVDEDGDVIDMLVQSRRDRRAAERFFRKVLKGQGCEPRRLITDKLRSYSAAHRTVMPSVVHDTTRVLCQTPENCTSTKYWIGQADPVNKYRTMHRMGVLP